MNDEKIIKRFVNKLHKLNQEYNESLTIEQYERIGDETTSCWLENMLSYIKKSEVIE
jgi:hypothetical protein